MAEQGPGLYREFAIVKPIASVVAAGFVLAVSLIASGARAQEADLSLRAELGKEMRYTYECREKSTNSTPGEPALTRGAEHGLGVTVKVIRRDESGGAAEVSLFWYSTAAISSTGRKVGFDSSKPKADEVGAPLAIELEPLLNKPVTVEFDAGGNVIDVTGVNALKHTQLTEKLKSELFSVRAMQHKIAPILGAGRQPPQAKVGDEWRTASSMPLSTRFAFDAKSQRKLARVNGDAAVIEGYAQISIPPVEPDAPVIAVLQSGDGASTQVWNTAKGALERYDAHHQMSAVLTINDTQRTMTIDLQESIRPTN